MSLGICSLYVAAHAICNDSLGPARLFEEWNLSRFAIPGIQFLDPSLTHLHLRCDFLGASSKLLLLYDVSYFDWIKFCHDSVALDVLIPSVSLVEIMS